MNECVCVCVSGVVEWVVQRGIGGRETLTVRTPEMKKKTTEKMVKGGRTETDW